MAIGDPYVSLDELKDYLKMTGKDQYDDALSGRSGLCHYGDRGQVQSPVQQGVGSLAAFVLSLTVLPKPRSMTSMTPRGWW